MKRFVSSKRFEAAAVAGALFLYPGVRMCGRGAPAVPGINHPPFRSRYPPELSLIAGSGGDWYTIEDGNLAAWGELHGGTDYSQHVTLFQGAQSVWGYRFVPDGSG